MYFAVGVVEHLRLAVAGNAIDLAVRRGGRRRRGPGVNGDGVDLQAVEFGNGAALAARRDAEELGARPAAGVEVALGILRQRPQVGRGGVEAAP